MPAKSSSNQAKRAPTSPAQQGSSKPCRLGKNSCAQDQWSATLTITDENNVQNASMHWSPSKRMPHQSRHETLLGSKATQTAHKAQRKEPTKQSAGNTDTADQTKPNTAQPDHQAQTRTNRPEDRPADCRPQSAAPPGRQTKQGNKTTELNCQSHES